MQEETGLTVSIDRLVYVVDSVEPAVPQLVYPFYFLAHPVTGQTPAVGFDPEQPPEAQVLSGAHFFDCCLTYVDTEGNFPIGLSLPSEKVVESCFPPVQTGE